jgi:hypothetical protein
LCRDGPRTNRSCLRPCSRRGIRGLHRLVVCEAAADHRRSDRKHGGRHGAYRIDQQAFDDGLRFFRQDQFAAARAAFDRADSAGQDAPTQFYIAYSYYREGWGRLYIDAESFRRGLDHVNKAIALAPGGRLLLDDANLQMRSADELKAELEAGMRREAADFNPLKIFRRRK